MSIEQAIRSLIVLPPEDAMQTMWLSGDNEGCEDNGVLKTVQLHKYVSVPVDTLGFRPSGVSLSLSLSLSFSP